jgi:hypothetical protein
MAWSVLSTGRGIWPNAVYNHFVDADDVSAFLQHPLWSSEPGEFVFKHPDLVVSRYGMQLELGPVEIRFPRFVVEHRAEVEAAGLAGTSVVARFACSGGATPVVSSLPARPDA